MKTGTAIVRIEIETDHLGPAMRELTEKQQRFVVALLETGGTNEYQAARLAGYGEMGARTRSYELARNPRVLAAIKEEALKRMQSGALMAASELYLIAGDRTHKDQLKAIDMLLNRGGLIVETKHTLTVQDNRTDDEIVARAAKFMKEMGMDPKAALARVGVEYVEAEFVEVTKPLPAEPTVDDLSDFLAGEN